MKEEITKKESLKDKLLKGLDLAYERMIAEKRKNQQKIDLRPISNNQVITVLGNEIKTLEKPKRGTKK